MTRVRKAFEMCAQGATNVEIVKETRIVSAKNGLSTLLRNRAYLGERIYNTTRRTDKKTIRQKNPETEIVRIPGSHPPIVSQELFDRVQAILDRKRPRRGGRQRVSLKDYILSGLLWCSEHNEPYAGYSTGQNDYYACALRRKHGKKYASCLIYKKAELEKFILDNLKRVIFTPERIREGLEWLAEEKARNEREDDTERDHILTQMAQLDVELDRFHKAIADGVMAEAVAKPINERRDKKRMLEKQLAEIEREKQKQLKIPKITEAMVDEVLAKTLSMFDNTDPHELKNTLAHFIDRIELKSRELAIYYSVAPSQCLAVNWRPRGDSNP